ncbi:unnamed protein product [Arctogadus glacialis]
MSAITLLALIFTLTVVSGAPLSDQVHQTPPEMVVAIKSGATVTLNCTHRIENYEPSPQHQVDQTPSDVLEEQNSSRVNLSCEHQIPNYDTILWYQRSQGSNQLDLIASVYSSLLTVEASFKGHFTVDGNGMKSSRLELLKPRSPEDTGVYYCAARMHCDEEPTYAGTKTLRVTTREGKPLFPSC